MLKCNATKLKTGQSIKGAEIAAFCRRMPKQIRCDLPQSQSKQALYHTYMNVVPDGKIMS